MKRNTLSLLVESDSRLRGPGCCPVVQSMQENQMNYEIENKNHVELSNGINRSDLRPVGNVLVNEQRRLQSRELYSHVNVENVCPEVMLPRVASIGRNKAKEKPTNFVPTSG